MLIVVLRVALTLNNINTDNRLGTHTFVLRNRLLRGTIPFFVKFKLHVSMRNRRTTNGNRLFSPIISQMENMLSMMTSEKPIERIRSLERKINEVDKIQTIENYIQQIKDRIWTVKEVLTVSEASAYLGLSESYIYKLTSLKQIPHYKPNGKLVYFNRKELCEWAMRNQIQTVGPTARIESEAL